MSKRVTPKNNHIFFEGSPFGVPPSKTATLQEQKKTWPTKRVVFQWVSREMPTNIPTSEGPKGPGHEALDRTPEERQLNLPGSHGLVYRNPEAVCRLLPAFLTVQKAPLKNRRPHFWLGVSVTLQLASSECGICQTWNPLGSLRSSRSAGQQVQQLVVLRSLLLHHGVAGPRARLSLSQNLGTPQNRRFLQLGGVPLASPENGLQKKVPQTTFIHPLDARSLQIQFAHPWD